MRDPTCARPARSAWSCSASSATPARPRSDAPRAVTSWCSCTSRSSSTCARRFANRGEPLDDLVQVGTIGLIKSVDRFDLERGVEFSTYATPTIVGEIKRHFRDKGWAIRVPRRLQELRMAISAATGDLSQELGRSPTVARSPTRSGSARRRCSRAWSPRTPTPRCPSTPATTRRQPGSSMLDSLGDGRRGARRRRDPRVDQAAARPAAEPRERRSCCCGSSAT